MHHLAPAALVAAGAEPAAPVLHRPVEELPRLVLGVPVRLVFLVHGLEREGRGLAFPESERGLDAAVGLLERDGGVEREREVGAVEDDAALEDVRLVLGPCVVEARLELEAEVELAANGDQPTDDPLAVRTVRLRRSA